MWRIFRGILSLPQNTVMNLNNVMKTFALNLFEVLKEGGGFNHHLSTYWQLGMPRCTWHPMHLPPKWALPLNVENWQMYRIAKPGTSSFWGLECSSYGGMLDCNANKFPTYYCNTCPLQYHCCNHRLQYDIVGTLSTTLESKFWQCLGRHVQFQHI